MSLIALSCTAVVGSTTVMINPETKVISAAIGGASSSDCAPRIVHNHMFQSPAEERRTHRLIVGNWVGETAVQNGGSRKFLAQHFEDGRFRLTYAVREDGGQEHIDVYVGKWGIAGPIYFTNLIGIVTGNEFEAVDPGNPGKYSVFEIIDIDDENFAYESLSPREKYTARRVLADAGLPAETLRISLQ
jgi:hypothetical protein